MPSIFILGASGYIGGAVVNALLRELPQLHATALVRNPRYAQELKGTSNVTVKPYFTQLVQDMGISTTLGTTDEFDKVYQLSSTADIILNVTSSTTIPLMQAILAGQRQFFNITGSKSVLIHTSGSALDLHSNEPGMLRLTTSIFNVSTQINGNAVLILVIGFGY